METKNMSYLKLSKSALAIVLCLALSLPPAGLKRSFAGSCSDCPQECPGADNSQKVLSLYLKVIQGYLRQLEQLCANSADGAREYIADVASDIPQPLNNDLKPVHTELLERIRIIKQEYENWVEEEYLKEWGERGWVVLERGWWWRELAFRGTPDLGGKRSSVWELQKQTESNYPLIWNGPGYVVDWQAHNAAVNHLDALKNRNRQITAAVVVFLRKVQNYYESTSKRLLTVAKAGAGYSCALARFLPEYKVKYYEKKYLRDNLLYAAHNSYCTNLCDLLVARVKQGLLDVDYDRIFNDWAWQVREITVKGRHSLMSIYGRQKLNKEFFKNCGRPDPVEEQWDSQEWGVYRGWPCVLGKIVAFIVPNRSDSVGPPLDNLNRPVWPADCGKERFQPALRTENAARENFRQGAMQLLTDLIRKLNAALDTYAPELPNHNSYRIDLSGGLSVLCGGEELNNPPKIKAEPMVYTGEPVKLNQTVTLQAAGIIEDDDKDSLNYSWVITDIPGDSLRYARYQTIATTENAKFTPDVAGTWKIQLSANDGREAVTVDIESRITEKDIQPATAGNSRRQVSLHSQPSQPAAVPGVLVKPKYALVFQHRDADIKLELHTPTPLEFPKKERYRFSGVPYYLERVEDRVSIQQVKSYNPDTKVITLASAGQDFKHSDAKVNGREGVCFIIHLPGTARVPLGMYTGDYGSSDLRNTRDPNNSDIYHGPVTSSVVLRSASPKSEKCEIELTVCDQNIDYLVFLNEQGCPKQVIPRESGRELTGTYSITQGIDRSFWKKDGSGKFQEYPKAMASVNADPNLPDWLERKAADVLNASPRSEYISQFKEENKGGLNAYVNSENPGVLFFNPSVCLSTDYRVHPRAVSRYGFANEYGIGMLDSIVLHEAHHMGYLYTVRTLSPSKELTGSNQDNDGDNDDLVKPGANNPLSVPVEYLLDSKDNLHGSYGPNRDPQTGWFLGTYAGDAVKDEKNESKAAGAYKVILLNIPLAQINFSQDLVIDLAQFNLKQLPLRRELVYKKCKSNLDGAPGITPPPLVMCIINGNANQDPGREPSDVEQEKILTGRYLIPQPKLRITFPEEWKAIADQCRKATLRAEVMVQSPEGAMEYDAESQSGGRYNGFWWK